MSLFSDSCHYDDYRWFSLPGCSFCIRAHCQALLSAYPPLCRRTMLLTFPGYRSHFSAGTALSTASAVIGFPHSISVISLIFKLLFCVLLLYHFFGVYTIYFTRSMQSKWFCHSFTSGSILSVILEIIPCDTSVPYISRSVSSISRCDIPLAYIAMIFCSISSVRVCLFSITLGSNSPLRSRNSYLTLAVFAAYCLFTVTVTTVT